MRGSPARAARYDVAVVGAGPNGLSAAIYLARAGLSVKLIEAAESVGGGLRSAELTLPGYLHDVCATVLPLAVGSPFLSSLPLAERGVRWVHPELCLAHPLGADRAAVLDRDLSATASALDSDGRSYRRLVEPLVSAEDHLLATFLGPLSAPRSLEAAVAAARFGLPALSGVEQLAKTLFKGEEARALFAGLGAHAMQPLGSAGTTAFALMLALLGHAHGWPFVAGGSVRLARALEAYLIELGGEVETGRRIESVDELSEARYVLLDLAPAGVLEVMGQRLSGRYRRGLQRYRYGPGVFKLDLALSGPVPWTAVACRRAGTVHVGGTLEEVAAAERLMSAGVHPEEPFVLVAQPSEFDAERAPGSGHTLWAYCHVPNGSDLDQTEPVLRQIERFAPGFRDLIVAVHSRTAVGYQRYDPNFVGGDINAGMQDLRQQFTRPVARLDPYSTPDPRVFICSSATPPGGGVHGMCGVGAARSLLGRLQLSA